MKKWYTINTTKGIKALGGIHGPITEPVQLDHMEVLKIIKQGVEVYEHNPYYKQEKVLVTVSNFNRIKFEVSRNEAIKRKNRVSGLTKRPIHTEEQVLGSSNTASSSETKEEDKSDSTQNNQNYYNNKHDKKNKHNKPEKLIHTDFEKQN